MLPPFTRGVLFADRREAGQALARRMAPQARRDDIVVLALSRGGVPVAYEMATALQAPLDVFLVRKLALAGKYVFLVDDGLATGSSMRSAVAAVRRLGAAHVTVAVPVGAHKVCNRPQLGADEVICLYMPEPFVAVGLWYQDFSQTSDDEVNRLLDKAAMGDEQRLLAVGA